MTRTNVRIDAGRGHGEIDFLVGADYALSHHWDTPKHDRSD